MEIETRTGLRLAVTGRELTGGLGVTEPVSSRRHYGPALLAVLLLALLVVPMAWTFGAAVHADLPVFGNFRDLFTDPAALRAAWHSVLWVGIALVLLAVGYVIAVLSRRVGRLWRILLYALILPFGVS
ncbi:MAG: sugar ABC transporter permease, partial [Actinomycetota bacterium]|nr:sugar ABC transporter permease [Actinomycetota bacterium]